MSACLPSGWAFGPWGKAAWGGGIDALPGGPLPVVAPFDVYCVGPCGPIAELLTYIDVTAEGSGDHFPLDGYTLDQLVRSGGAAPIGEAVISIDTAVPEDFTVEFVVSFAHLPSNFANLVERHIYLGASDGQGACAALFFSKVGLLYTGCAHFDGVDIASDTVLQPLANSELLVSENEYWTIRLSVSSRAETTYVYVTKTADVGRVGHQLRYILPTIPSRAAAIVPPDRTLIMVRGTAAQPSHLSLQSVCLGTGLIIPNILPVADPGPDQALALCEVLRLDGSRSYDPEGARLGYKWRLVDAPPVSSHTFLSTDGYVVADDPPTGFTDRLYSGALGALHAIDPILSGTVLVVDGEVHNIATTGLDQHGFFVRVEGYVLNDALTRAGFTLLRQNGINSATDVKPTFYPDVPGLFKFDLTVFDGGLYSTAASVVTNVLESPLARGVTPDLSFIWKYLSDFWNLVEDTERIDVFWQGLAQAAAAELLTLWQVDYSKSLRDVQRTFQRRWLHYDMLMEQSTTLRELSVVTGVSGGLSSMRIPVAGQAGLSGTQLVLILASQEAPIRVVLDAADPVTPDVLQVELNRAFLAANAPLAATLLFSRDGVTAQVRIAGGVPFFVDASSTCPLFTAGAAPSVPFGTEGAAVGTQSYRTEKSLAGLSIPFGTFLCVDGVAYRIANVVDDPSDPLYFQRVVLTEPLAPSVGRRWSIAGTALSQDLDFWNGLCEEGDVVTFEVLHIPDQQLVEVTSQVLGSSQAVPMSLACDTTPVSFYLAQPQLFSVFLRSVLRRKYIPIDPLIVDVPFLQEKIANKDDAAVLRRNVDFFVEELRGQTCLRFVTPVPYVAGEPDVWDAGIPPARLWAEVSYLDNRPRIEANFGIPAAFTLDDLAELPSNVDYLSSVRGLWYAYFNGPTLFNLRVGTQILLGLPFAEETGTIVEIRNDFSATSGRILVQDVATASITRSYGFPRTLVLEENPTTKKPYTVGDTVLQFAPLVTGVEVIDYVKDPTWFGGILNQGIFFEVEKFFRFIVRVQATAFDIGALLFAQTFVRRIKPTYTYPLFVVVAPPLVAEVSVTDARRGDGRLYLFDGANFRDSYGVATMFDEPNASGGGLRSRFDTGPLRSEPSAPNADVPVMWAFDRDLLSPEDSVVATVTRVLAQPALPQFDDPIIVFDTPVWTSDALAFASGNYHTLFPGAGTAIGHAQTPTAATWDYLLVEGNILEAPPAGTCRLVIRQNGASLIERDLALVDGQFRAAFAFTDVHVGATDAITAVLVSKTGQPIHMLVGKVLVTVGRTVPWAFDVDLPAGTYKRFLLL